MFKLLDFIKRVKKKFIAPSSGRRTYVCKYIEGKDNKVLHSGSQMSMMKLDIVGDSNEVIIGEGSVLNNVKIYIRGNNNNIIVGKSCRFINGSDLWIENDRCVLSIGDNTSFVDAHLAVTESGSRIDIGSDCMFAYDIDVRTGDSHSIVEVETGKRINQARDVFIDDHVWVAAHVNILKGVRLRSNSVVATGSVLVKGGDEANVIYAGNPAKIVKRNIQWMRERV